MGRISKIELLDLLERAEKLHNVEHKSYKEIEEIFRSEGYDVSREGIRRVVKNSSEAALDFKKAAEESRAIVSAVLNNPNTDSAEAVVGILTHKLLESSKTIESIIIDDPVKLADVVSKLTHAQVKISSLRLEYSKGFEAAKKEFVTALNAELKKFPELLIRLNEVISGMEADV